MLSYDCVNHINILVPTTSLVQGIKLLSSINMASTLQPYQDTINAELTALRQDVRSLATELDTSGSSTVMGPALLAGRSTPGDIANQILADEFFGAERISSVDMVKARKNVRQMMDEYAEKIALATVNEARSTMQSEYIAKAAVRSQSIFDRLQAVEDKSNALIRATNRIPGAGKMSAQRKLAKERYDKSIALVNNIAERLGNQRTQIAELTKDIDEMLYGTASASCDAVVLKQKQDTRESVEKEQKYAEKSLVQHFNPGTMTRRNDSKGEVEKFWCPTDIAEKDRGAEFMKRNLKTLYQCATEYWAVIPEVDLTCNSFDPSSGSYHKPPSGADGYMGVADAMRNKYSEHASTLYDKLESKIPEATRLRLNRLLDMARALRSTLLVQLEMARH